MKSEKHDQEPFRVIRWHPGIRGAKRSFQLRVMFRDGKLWFACQDVQVALGWSKRELCAARHERLDGNTWGATYAQWRGRGPRLAFISWTALSVVMAGRHARRNRAFLRWLDSLKDVAVPGDAEDFSEDLITGEDYSAPAYKICAVNHEQVRLSIWHLDPLSQPAGSA